MRKKLLKSVIIGTLLMSGCSIKDYSNPRTKSELENYIHEYIGIQDFVIHDEPEYIKQYSIADRVWTVERTDDLQFSFYVMEVDSGQEGRGRLQTNYGGELLKYYYETSVQDESEGLIQLVTTPHEILSYANYYYLLADIANVKDLEIISTAFENLLNQDEYPETHSETLYYSFSYPNKDIIYPDSIALMDRIQRYDLDESFGSLTIKKGSDVYQKMQDKYIAFSAKFGLEDQLLQFDDKVVSEVIESYYGRIYINNDGDIHPIENAIFIGNGEVSWANLYHILKDAEYPVEGDVYDFTVYALDGDKYNFSYDFITVSDNRSSDQNQGFYHYKYNDELSQRSYTYPYVTPQGIYTTFGIFVEHSENIDEIPTEWMEETE